MTKTVNSVVKCSLGSLYESVLDSVSLGQNQVGFLKLLVCERV
jgi:hypothetical protein